MIKKRISSSVALRKMTLALCGLTLLAFSFVSKAQTSYKFDFGTGAAAAGYTKVLPTSKYTASAKFGFDSCSGAIVGVSRGGADVLTGDFCTSGNDLPFSFSFDCPEGNYRVSVIVGDLQGPSKVTINAESHRLMMEKISVPAGQFVTKTFMVNRRDPKISTGGSIGLKTRAWPNTNEPDMLNWDGRLTLEFCDGRQQNICAVEAVKIDTALQVILCGNSTCTDQEYSPWASWGQMIPRFFNDKVVIVNLAESGLSAGSFGDRMDKAVSIMKEGDYCFIEFGHNDKSGTEAAFVTNMTGLVNKVKAAKGKPVIVTPICRAGYFSGATIPVGTGTIDPYSTAARKLATTLNTGLVELTFATKTLLESVGSAKAKKYYVSYSAAELQAHHWTRFDKATVDDGTHTNICGAYEYAQCAKESIKKNLPDLAKYLLTDVPTFDPAKPDDPATWLTTWTWSPYPDVKGDTKVSLQIPATTKIVEDKTGFSIDISLSTILFSNPQHSNAIQFSLYTTNGKQVAQIKLTNNKANSFVWDGLTNLKAGAYFVEMKIQGDQAKRVLFTKM